MEEIKKPFLGRGWGFPPTFDKVSNSVEMVEGEADINESLFLLISTIQGERVMLPDYGFGTQIHVFDGADNSMLTYLKGEIADAILHFEPRIRVEEISIDASQSVDGRLAIHLSYFIPSTNSRSNMVFPFYIAEGTNIRTS